MTFFGDVNFGNTSAMAVILFSKYSKVNVDFKKAEKNWEKFFSFWGNSMWMGCLKLSLYRREYFSSSENLLRNSPKILHSTNIDSSQLDYVHSDKQIL